MRENRRLGLARLVLVPLLLGPAPAVLAGPEEPGHCQTTPLASETLELQVPDVPVLTQDGRAVRFYTDLVQGKVVAINFIFTSCTTICPPLGVTFSKLQGLLGDRLGTEVHLISVSVDPATDTPERLRAWAAKFGARPGWTLVAGRKADIDTLLKGLNAFTARPGDHTPIVLIGNDQRRSWTRAYGLAPAATLARAIGDSLNSAARAAAPERP